MEFAWQKGNFKMKSSHAGCIKFQGYFLSCIYQYFYGVFWNLVILLFYYKIICWGRMCCFLWNFYSLWWRTQFPGSLISFCKCREGSLDVLNFWPSSLMGIIRGKIHPSILAKKVIPWGLVTGHSSIFKDIKDLSVKRSNPYNTNPQ